MTLPQHTLGQRYDMHLSFDTLPCVMPGAHQASSNVMAATPQVYPSYFEAPSAATSLLPDGLLFRGGLLPIVTMAFCAPEGLKALEVARSRVAKQALEMFCSAVRTTLGACRGYECQEKDGIFMLGFSDTGAWCWRWWWWWC